MHQRLFWKRNLQDLIFEVAFLANKAVAKLHCIELEKIKLSYVENALIFMPSLLPICLGLTIWVSPKLRGSV